MSYSIHVYPIQLKEAAQANNPEFNAVMDFIEARENLVSFSADQVKLIEEHLKKRKYELLSESNDKKRYEHREYPSVEVLFVPTGLFFMARGQDIMEITMTAGEFNYFPTLKGCFAVLDPQNEGWQD